MTRPSVVLVGLDCPTGLQSARVFAARGVEVIGVAADPKHPCAQTRRCRRIVRAGGGPGELVPKLMDIGRTLPTRAVLVPCTDRSVLDVARNRGELSAHYLMAMPSAEVIESLIDKVRFARFAASRDLPVPATFIVEGKRELEAAAASVGYPCVLKPSIKSRSWTNHTAAKVLRIESRGELIQAYARHATWADAFIVQAWIPGADHDHYTCDCYIGRDGTPLVTFCSRKLRQWPPHVGQGCLSVECRNDIVRDTALRLFRDAGHRGQGYLEMKRDADSGRYLIVEANVGRPTGRAAAAEGAGVELLMTMYCDLVGAPLPAERTQTFRGTKWVHERRDLQAVLSLLAKRKARPLEIARSWRGTRACALFSWADPKPFMADCRHVLWQALRRRLARFTAQARSERADAYGESGRRSPVDTSAAHSLSVGPARAEVFDVDVGGVLTLRVHDAGSVDVATIGNELGTTPPPTDRRPDVVLCFVDDLDARDVIAPRRPGPAGSVLVEMMDGRPVATARLSDSLDSSLVVCRRGLGRVPLLEAALDLAALGRGWVPLHAAAWVSRGKGVLAVGLAGAGKTTALLAACGQGATPLSDDRVLLSDDGRRMVGLGSAASLSEWHVANCDLTSAGVGSVRRATARVATLIHGLAAHLKTVRAAWMRPAKRAVRSARRRFGVRVSLERMGRASATASPDVFVLLESHDRSDVVAERIAPEAAALRLADAFEAEFTLPETLPASIAIPWSQAPVRDLVAGARRSILEATRQKPCYVVRHPRRCSLTLLRAAFDTLTSSEVSKPQVAHVPDVVVANALSPLVRQSAQ